MHVRLARGAARAPDRPDAEAPALLQPASSGEAQGQPDTGHVDAAGSPLHYKLAAVDVHGNVSRFASWSPNEALGVPAHRPAGIAFAPPSPNPAARSATLRFALPAAARVRLAVLDVAAREVRVLADGALAAGEHARVWDLRDWPGRDVSAGVYFARLDAEGRTLVRRLAVAR